MTTSFALRELKGQFVAVTEAPNFRVVETRAEAQGVMFLCPKCFEANGGARGTHMVVCWSRSAGAPKAMTPGPGRWKMDGADLDDLTLNADPPGKARSVLLHGGCAWHGFVNSGRATTA